jgi:hypothetical protein
MNFRSRLFLLLGIVFITACKKDFLQRDPGAPITEDIVFRDPVLAARFADNAYNFTLDEYGRMSQGYKGTTGQFCDEAVASGASDSYPFISIMTLGKFLDPNATDVAGVYTRMYQGIRNVNVMLSKIDSVPWTALQSPKLIEAQMLFLRGLYYFELVKRFGGVVLLDKASGLSDNIDLPRNSYEETVNFILKDLENAEKILTTEIFDLPSGRSYAPETDWDARNYGRATTGAVRALRLRLLMLDATAIRRAPQQNGKKQRMPQNKSSAAASFRLIPTIPLYLIDPALLNTYLSK